MWWDEEEYSLIWGVPQRPAGEGDLISTLLAALLGFPITLLWWVSQEVHTHRMGAQPCCSLWSHLPCKLKVRCTEGL